MKNPSFSLFKRCLAAIIFCAGFSAGAAANQCEGGKGHAPDSVVPFGAAGISISSMAIAKPTVVSRTSWGCPDGQNSPNWTPWEYTTVTHLIVHHSGDAYNGSDWRVEVRRIWDFHTKPVAQGGRGWGDIGYNYLIDPNGIIYEGRAGGDSVIGAHFCSKNGETLGVCVLGNFQSTNPTQAALNSLKSLLAWKAGQRGINPLGASLHSNSGLNLNNISGHQDGCSTECPGNNLYSLLPSIRTDVNNLINGGSAADLTIVEPVVPSPSSVAPGGTIRVDWTEKNKGTAASTPAHNTKHWRPTGMILP